MERAERLLALAVERGHLKERRVRSLLSLVSMRQGDVHTAGELLSTYHDVPAEEVSALVAEVLAAPAPAAPEASPEPSGALIAPRDQAPACSGEGARVALAPLEGASAETGEEELVEFELVGEEEAKAVGGARPARRVEDLGEDAHAVLIVYPISDPSKAQVSAYSDALGVILYEARLRLADSLPRLADAGPASQLLPKVERLREAKIHCLCVEHEALFPALRSLTVTAVERDGFALELKLMECWENDATLPRAETVHLDLDRPRLLVVGRYDFEARGTVKQSRGIRSRKKVYRTEAREFVSFGHLYYANSETPIEFNDDQIVDYAFLQDEKGVSKRQNLKRLLAMIAPGRGATRDDSLLKKAGRILSAVTSVGPGAAEGRGLAARAGDRQTSNVAQADALSRAIYFRWLERLG